MATNKDTGCVDSSGALSFRFAVREDAPLIHRMVADLSAFLGESEKHQASIADYERYGFGDKPKFECVIAEHGSDAVGMCLFFDSFSTWIGRPGVYVQDLYVSDKVRGLGLGKKLLAHVASIGQARGCAYLRLSVDADNVSAQKFYESCSLQWSSSEKVYAVRNEAFFALAALDAK